MIRNRIIISLWLIFLTVITGCSSTKNDVQLNTIVYGLTLEPSGIDPHIYQSSELGIVLRSVYDTLVYRNPETLEIIPGLATSWQRSDDGLVYTFSLREGVTFHDGTPFNAQAVGANLDRIVDPETASQRARFMLGSYVGYEVVDDYTIRVNLADPYTPLLDAFSQVYLSIASPAAFNEYSRNRYQFYQVGTGPFRFIEYVPNDRIVIRRWADYTWGPSFYDLPVDNSVEEVVFRFFEDEATRLLAIESGDVNVMGELPPTDARALSGNSQIQLLPVDVPGQPLQFMFNIEQFPTDNPVVRQALIIATNRNAIVDTVFQGFSSAAWGPLAEGSLFYNRQMVGVYEHNAQQARDLLAAQGFVDSDGDGYLDTSDGDVEIVLIVPPWGRVPQVVQLLQDQWRDIGIRVVLDQVPNFNLLREAVDAGEYNLVSFDTPGIDPALLNDYFITGGVRNWMGYSNPELDSILQEAVRIADDNQRRTLYLEAQRIIMNNALVLPIREYRNLNAADNSVENLQFDAYGWFPILNNVRLSTSG